MTRSVTGAQLPPARLGPLGDAQGARVPQSRSAFLAFTASTGAEKSFLRGQTPGEVFGHPREDLDDLLFAHVCWHAQKDDASLKPEIVPVAYPDGVDLWERLALNSFV